MPSEVQQSSHLFRKLQQDASSQASFVSSNRFNSRKDFSSIMNLRRKSRCKLKIFGSFGGSKSRPRQFRSEADLTSGGDKSVPVLLGIRHNHEDLGSLQHLDTLDRAIDRHRSVVTTNVACQ